jgi:RHS repeat-associated protein
LHLSVKNKFPKYTQPTIGVKILLLDWCANDNMINAMMASFYFHDRLGSVRQIIDTSGNVENRYTYRPFGESYDDEGEVEETITNPFKFTGQYFDAEIDEYYLRARQYDPHIGRFTSRDPVFGKFREPLTLHMYLYCLNNPTNLVDPNGLWSIWGLLVGEPDWEPTEEQREELEEGFKEGLKAGGEIALNEYTFSLTDYLGWTKAAERIKEHGAAGKLSKWFAKASKYSALAAIGMGAMGWNLKISTHWAAHGHGGAHLQFNWWIKGVKGSGKAMRWVFWKY